MIRVRVVVEGQTEESFVNEVLAEFLWRHNVQLAPILLGVPGHRGGRPNYARVKKDVITHLKQERTAYCSTMLDLYRLGGGFPGMPVPERSSGIETAIRIEEAMKKDICQKVPNLRPEDRFVPYIQLHEFEALLFSDPPAFARAIHQSSREHAFQSVRDSFPTPEDINDGPDTAPSKRILRVCRSYRKVLNGTLAARAVGIDAMRRECPHFRHWLDQLATLGAV